jgi:hypothetical protein
VIVEHVPKQCLDLGGEVQPASDVSKFSHLHLHDCSHIRRKIDCLLLQSDPFVTEWNIPDAEFCADSVRNGLVFGRRMKVGVLQAP